MEMGDKKKDREIDAPTSSLSKSKKNIVKGFSSLVWLKSIIEAISYFAKMIQ